MKLSNKGRYAVQALADLARNGLRKPTNLTEISPGALRREHQIFWGNWLLAENIFEYNWINYPAMRELRWVSLIDRKKELNWKMTEDEADWKAHGEWLSQF